MTCNVNQYFHSNKLNFCKIKFFFFFKIISLSLIACSKHIAPNFVGWLLHYKIIHSVNTRNLLFGMAKSFKQENYILTKGQKLPIVRSALQGMVFCLDLGPFFFFFS